MNDRGVFACLSFIACLFISLVACLFVSWLFNIPATFQTYFKDASIKTTLRAAALEVTDHLYNDTRPTSSNTDPVSPNVLHNGLLNTISKV